VTPSRIIAVHLLNDFSGSPCVFRQSLEVLQQQGFAIELYTATPDGKGFLSEIPGLRQHRIFYKWHRIKWITLLLFIGSQLSLFGKILLRARRSDTVYINALLPFGAALAARCRGCRVYYHVHETSIRPQLLKQWLLFVANLTCHKAFFVSHDLLQRTAFRKPAFVLHNALPDAFTRQALQHRSGGVQQPFMVLMLCSLKTYKGVYEFIAIAQRLPQLQFELVLNATQLRVDDFCRRTAVPANCRIFAAQEDTHPFYRRASVVLNLSRTSEWIETFGMTILEAMYYRRPVIVPPVGGIAELVQPAIEGYHINSNDINRICETLQYLQQSPAQYRQLSDNAFKRAQQFTQQRFAAALLQHFAWAEEQEKDVAGQVLACTAS
jgi:glycosyltransferase involved in cell wall biosynthesis